MAHHIRVKEIPHTNKDGSKSETKKDYQILDRTRGKKIEVGVVSSRAAIKKVVADWRDFVFRSHVERHPKARAPKKTG